MLKKIINLVFGAAFALSAAVQYNDPDPLRWVALYLAAAFMCLCVALQRPVRPLAPLLLVLSLLWIGTLLPGLTGNITLKEIFGSINMSSRGVEVVREVGGLSLVALWSGILALRLKIPGLN